MKCFFCDDQHPSQLVKATDIRSSLFKFIKHKHPEFSEKDVLCHKHLNNFRIQFIEAQLKHEKKKLNALDEDVLKSVREQGLLSSTIDHSKFESVSFGQKLADRIAEFGGSWGFIIFFGSFLAVWIGINIWFLETQPFDPYPFILLNLLLSCLAAIQAPVIMMSQNRKEARDRLRAENDYKINLKAEIEIKNLHDKIDYLMQQQWKGMMEVQQMQIELMEDIMKKMDNKGNA